MTRRASAPMLGLAALASVGCWLASLIFANATAVGGPAHTPVGADAPPALSASRQLLSFHVGAGDQLAATILRCAGLALTALAGTCLYRIVRARRPTVDRRIVWLAAAGTLLVAAATVFGFVALGHVADAYVAAGARTAARARQLIHDSGALKLAAVLDTASRLVLAVWIVVAVHGMASAGLLDRFLAYWGYGAAFALVVLPVGDAMFVAWLGSVGVIALGYWPGGRPEGWQRIATPA